MDGIWYHYHDNSDFAELYDELNEYMDDPAIYELNATFPLFHYQNMDAYVTANAVSLVLSVLCSIGIALGPRGLAFDVFVMKAITLVVSSSLLIGVPYIKRWRLDTADIPVNTLLHSGLEEPKIKT